VKKINYALSLILSLIATSVAAPAFALPENTVQAAYATTIVPFLQTGKTFTFNADDGLPLSGVYFANPGSTKTIVVVNGRAETWLKFGEVFYDLYQKGYSIYSYDHRGQGLSPHLSKVSSEIGYVRHFAYYVEDLNTFVTKVVLPNSAGQTLYLLAHSMGGAIAAGYLSEYETPFKNAVLSCPMLQINTAPYTELVAKTIVVAETVVGLGMHYAKNQTDYVPNLPLSKSTTTSSAARWWLTNQTYNDHPTTILGGPANRWVWENIDAGHWVRNEMGHIKIPFIMFQAGLDQFVEPAGENEGCANAGPMCTLIKLPTSQHETMMERDEIRDQVMATIENQFQ
jgi:lysophospholipase